MTLVPYWSDSGMYNNLTVAADVLWGQEDKELIYVEGRYDLIYLF